MGHSAAPVPSTVPQNQVVILGNRFLEVGHGSAGRGKSTREMGHTCCGASTFSVPCQAVTSRDCVIPVSGAGSPPPLRKRSVKDIHISPIRPRLHLLRHPATTAIGPIVCSHASPIIPVLLIGGHSTVKLRQHTHDLSSPPGLGPLVTTPGASISLWHPCWKAD